jgi:hypothetical protein
MSRILAATVMLCALLLTSCMDPEPAEISVIVKQGGQTQNCIVQLFNDAGKQLQEEATANGFVYLKNLVPGTYIIKFKDRNNNMYPAVRKVNLGAGDSTPVEVDLDDTSSNPPDA